MKKIIKKLVQKAGFAIVSRYVVPLDLRQIKNVAYYSGIFSKVTNIPGAFVECGVGRGRSFLYFCAFIFKEKKGRLAWGFDSFEGFPEPTKEDDSVRNPKKGEWSGISPDDIKGILKTAGIHKDFIDSKVRLIKGFFNESLKKYDDAPIAILHVDVDLYQSYKDVLSALYPRVVSQGIVLFDEYQSPKWPGATKAIDEFFAKEKDRITLDSDSGKYYFIKT